jgi:hypothetical protein
MERMVILILLFTLFLFPMLSFAEEGEGGAYIRVEIRGILETGMLAVGGETTGTVIRANNVTWELDFGGNRSFQELATRLNGQWVLVTGTYHKGRGVEVAERHIVRVTGLEPAEEK